MVGHMSSTNRCRLYDRILITANRYKGVPGMAALHRAYPRAKWYIMIDDDTCAGLKISLVAMRIPHGMSLVSLHYLLHMLIVRLYYAVCSTTLLLHRYFFMHNFRDYIAKFDPDEELYAGNAMFYGEGQNDHTGYMLSSIRGQHLDVLCASQHTGTCSIKEHFAG